MDVVYELRTTTHSRVSLDAAMPMAQTRRDSYGDIHFAKGLFTAIASI